MRIERWETEVTGNRKDEQGTWVTLRDTYFYAEAGGQPADVGTVAGIPVAQVLEVDGETWHLLEQDVPLAGTVDVWIDLEKRDEHSVQHTAQHVLSALLEDRYGIKTLSFRIGATHSEIELDVAELDWEVVKRIEYDVQRLIFENRPVRTHVIPFEELDQSRLRKPTVRDGLIRVVEIEGLDYNACGGTHVTYTGQIGQLVVQQLSKVRGNVRLEYVAGIRALQAVQQARTVLREINQTLSTTTEQAARRVVEERSLRLEREKELKYAETRLAQAKVAMFLQEDHYVVYHHGKSETESLTTMIVERIAASGRIAVGVNRASKKLWIMHDGTHDVSAGKFLKHVLATFEDGRGGGSHKQAQARFEDELILETVAHDVVRRLQEGQVI